MQRVGGRERMDAGGTGGVARVNRAGVLFPRNPRYQGKTNGKMFHGSFLMNHALLLWIRTCVLKLVGGIVSKYTFDIFPCVLKWVGWGRGADTVEGDRMGCLRKLLNCLAQSWSRETRNFFRDVSGISSGSKFKELEDEKSDLVMDQEKDE